MQLFDDFGEAGIVFQKRCVLEAHENAHATGLFGQRDLRLATNDGEGLRIFVGESLDGGDGPDGPLEVALRNGPVDRSDAGVEDGSLRDSGSGCPPRRQMGCRAYRSPSLCDRVQRSQMHRQRRRGKAVEATERQMP
jgi:hypothetical protein